MNIFLLVILFILVIVIGGRRGIKTFLSILINFILLMGVFYFIVLGFNPIIVSIVGCLLTSYIILYFMNGRNQKTKVSFISIILVFIILAFLIYFLVDKMNLGGFGLESSEEINMFSYDIGADMLKIEIAVILIGLIGAIIDTSIAVSSALYEVNINNPALSIKELFQSGMSIGKDLLCTTVNTLFFAYISDFMTLLIWFKICKYSLGDIVNAKVFVSEFIKIMCSGLGCVIIIPITAILAAEAYKRNLLFEED